MSGRTNPQLKLVIIGAGVYLDLAYAAWHQAFSEREVERFELPSGDPFAYDLSILDGYDPSSMAIFVALGPGAINFSRMAVMNEVKLRGFFTEKFISPHAVVHEEFLLGENGFVADGAVVAPGVTVRHNVYIGARAFVGFGSKIGHSVWIEAGANVGHNVSIGDNTTIGRGVVLSDELVVGRQCELLVDREYRQQIPDKTFYSPLFENPVRIYKGAL